MPNFFLPCPFVYSVLGGKREHAFCRKEHQLNVADVLYLRQPDGSSYNR